MNIFDKLAQDNDFGDFSAVVETPNQATEFSEISEVSDQKSQGNIFQQLASKEVERKDNELGYLGTLRDVAEQVVTKGASGLVGAYGNILDSFGLQPKQGQSLPGQQTRNSAQFEVLDKLNRGEQPTLNELMLLSDDDVLPSFNRIPTTKEVEKGIESATGIGEGKTPPGRILGRGASFAGEGISTGGGVKTLLSLAASGSAGQSIRESGGPEWAATGTEIIGPIGSTAISKTIAPLTKSAKETVNSARKIGLSESSIAPLLQSEGKVSLIAPLSRKGTRTKKAFAQLKEELGDSYQRIKNNPSASTPIGFLDQRNLGQKFTDIRSDLMKTLAPSPDKEAAIKYIETAIDTLQNKSVSPEYLINFWQDINKSVNWNSINGGKKALTRLKEPISESLKKNVPALAEDFEITNQLYSKYANISKKLKPDMVDSFVNKGEIVSAIPSALSLVNGNPYPLLGLAGEVATRILSREMLINPYFQTIAGKLVKNFNAGSVKGIQGTVKQVQEYMQRKHPNEDWSFLTTDLSAD